MRQKCSHQYHWCCAADDADYAYPGVGRAVDDYNAPSQPSGRLAQDGPASSGPGQENACILQVRGCGELSDQLGPTASDCMEGMGGRRQEEVGGKRAGVVLPVSWREGAQEVGW